MSSWNKDPGYTDLTTINDGNEYQPLEGIKSKDLNKIVDNITALHNGAATLLNIENGAGDSSIKQKSSAVASGIASNAFGISTYAQGYASHAEGQLSVSNGQATHAEGLSTRTTGTAGHAEGYNTQAIAGASHAEGSSSQAKGDASHAEGNSCQAIGNATHAEGLSTRTSDKVAGQHASGRYNEVDAQALFVIGNGSSESVRTNAFIIKTDGSARLQTRSYDDNSVVTYYDIKNQVDKSKDQIITGIKTFSNYIKTPQVASVEGKGLVRYKSTEGKSVFGNDSTAVLLMGDTDRPYYSNSGSDFTGQELALKADVPSIIKLTQAEYDALTEKDSATLYIIVG